MLVRSSRACVPPRSEGAQWSLLDVGLWIGEKEGAQVISGELISRGIAHTGQMFNGKGEIKMRHKKNTASAAGALPTDSLRSPSLLQPLPPCYRTDLAHHLWAPDCAA